MKIINVLRYLFYSDKPGLDDSAPWKKIFNIVLYVLIISFITITILTIIINTNIFKEPFITEIKPANKKHKIEKINKIIDNNYDNNFQIIIAGENKGTRRFWKLSDKIYKYDYLHNKTSNYSNIISNYDSVCKMKYENNNFEFITDYGSYGKINFNHGMEYIKSLPLIMKRDKKIINISDIKKNNEVKYKLIKSNSQNHVIFYNQNNENFTDGRFLKWENIYDKKLYKNDFFGQKYFVDEYENKHLLLIGSKNVFYPYLINDELLCVSKLSFSGFISDEYLKNINKYIFIKDKLIILDREKQDRCIIGNINLEKKSLQTKEKSFYGDVYKNYFIEKEIDDKDNKGFLLRHKYNLKSDFYIYDTINHEWFHPVKEEIKERIKQIIPYKEGVLLILYSEHNILDRILYFNINKKESKDLYSNTSKVDFDVLTDNELILLYKIDNKNILFNIINPDSSDLKNNKYKKLRLFYSNIFIGDNIKILGLYNNKIYFFDKTNEGGDIYTLDKNDYTLKKILFLKGEPTEVKIDDSKKRFILYMNDNDGKYAYFLNYNRKTRYKKKIELNENIIFLYDKMILITNYNGKADASFDKIYKLIEDAYIIKSSDVINNPTRILDLKNGTITPIDFPYEIIKMNNKYILTKDTGSKNIFFFENSDFLNSNQKTSFKPKMIYYNTDIKSSFIKPEYLLNKDGVDILLFKDSSNKPNLLYKEDNEIFISEFTLTEDDRYESLKNITLLSKNKKHEYIVNFDDYLYLYKINSSKNIMKLTDVKSLRKFPVVDLNNYQIISDYTEYFYIYDNKSERFKKEKIQSNYFDKVIKIDEKKIAFDKNNNKIFIIINDEINHYKIDRQQMYLKKIYLSKSSDYYILGTKNECILYEYKNALRKKIGKLKFLNKVNGIYYLVFEPFSDKSDIIIQIDDYDNHDLIEEEMFFKKYEINKNLLKKIIINNKNKVDVFQYKINKNKLVSLIGDEFFIEGFTGENLEYEELNGLYAAINNNIINFNVIYVDKKYYLIENNKLLLLDQYKNFSELIPGEVYYFNNKYFTDYNVKKVNEIYRHYYGFYYFDNTLYYNSEDFLSDFSFKIIESDDLNINNISKNLFGYKYKKNNEKINNLNDLNLNIDPDNIFIDVNRLVFENNKKYYSINLKNEIINISKSEYEKIKYSFVKANVTTEKSISFLMDKIKNNKVEFFSSDKDLKIIKDNKDFFTYKSFSDVDFINNKIILKKDNDSKIFINSVQFSFEKFDENEIKNKIENKVQIKSYSSESDYIINNYKIINKNDLYNDILIDDNNIYLTNDDNRYKIENINDYDGKIKSRYFYNITSEYPNTIFEDEAVKNNIYVMSYENENTVKKRIKEFKDESFKKITTTGINLKMYEMINNHKKGFLFDNLKKKKLDAKQKKIYLSKLLKLNINESEISYYKEYDNKIFFFTENGTVITIKKIKSPYYSLNNYLSCFPNLFYVIIMAFIFIFLMLFIFYKIILYYK